MLLLILAATSVALGCSSQRVPEPDIGSTQQAISVVSPAPTQALVNDGGVVNISRTIDSAHAPIIVYGPKWTGTPVVGPVAPDAGEGSVSQ